ncbi:MAG: non-heme iron oxygenase ferredoxin subunit [Ardenticatenaceae bacterium]|nr:non-heme iron oxygenase ferredoxin subunit [Ardenticatenaceae bacterium]HBY92630.1 biphenyl 2,3-dioxygenase [Chloroflexota bacterium]
MATFHTVAKTSDVPPGHAIVVELDDYRIALANVGGNEFYAIDDVCTHDGGPLGEGQLDGYAIECPRHGARFDVRDGRVLSMPAIIPVSTYDVRVVDGEVQVAIPAE